MKTDKLRTVLARRLRELMDATPALDTQMKIAARSGIAQSTVGRILRGDVAVTLDNVEALADAFGRDPADLLTYVKSKARAAFQDAVAGLPAAEIEKVSAYARFVKAQHTEHHQPTFNLEKETAGIVDNDAALQRAAKRPVTARNTITMDSHDNSHDHHEGTRSKTGGGASHRRNKRH